MRSNRAVRACPFFRGFRLRWSIAVALTALFVIAPLVALADVEFWFFPAEGGTHLRVTGTGVNNDFGGVFGHSFSNLVGGDPFDSTLSDESFSVGTIAMSSGVNLISVTLDSDGAGSADMDDFSIGFDGLFSMGATYTFDETVVVPGLDFGDLNVGEYTRVSNRFGTMTLRITNVGPGVSQVPGMSLLGLLTLAGTLSATARSRLRKEGIA